MVPSREVTWSSCSDHCSMPVITLASQAQWLRVPLSPSLSSICIQYTRRGVTWTLSLDTFCNWWYEQHACIHWRVILICYILACYWFGLAFLHSCMSLGAVVILGKYTGSDRLYYTDTNTNGIMPRSSVTCPSDCTSTKQSSAWPRWVTKPCHAWTGRIWVKLFLFPLFSGDDHVNWNMSNLNCN